ncbi:MAG TPA: DUF4118 domain-containing protein [Terriglobales bacterium]
MQRRCAAWIGCSCCALLAALVIPFVNDTSLETFVPFFFLIVIVSTAIHFGSLAGVLGTVAAGFLFAVFLFRPTASLLIDDLTARNHLVWMLFIGLILSELLGARPGPKKNKLQS